MQRGWGLRGKGVRTDSCCFIQQANGSGDRTSGVAYSDVGVCTHRQTSLRQAAASCVSRTAKSRPLSPGSRACLHRQCPPPLPAAPGLAGTAPSACALGPQSSLASSLDSMLGSDNNREPSPAYLQMGALRSMQPSASPASSQRAPSEGPASNQHAQQRSRGLSTTPSDLSNTSRSS